MTDFDILCDKKVFYEYQRLVKNEDRVMKDMEKDFAACYYINYLTLRNYCQSGFIYRLFDDIPIMNCRCVVLPVDEEENRQ